ncbi:MAG: nucleotidyltransferase domain-containing protein [Planctomycetota bacterium]
MIEIIEQRRADVGALCRQHGVKKLEIFGSATGSAWDPARSDLDFLVEFLAGHDLGPWMGRYFEFKEQLERLFERPVDVIFASALKNAYFRREVDRTRIAVYVA